MQNRIIAIDPGFARCGVAILQKENGKDVLLYSDCIETDKKAPLSERISHITSLLHSLIKEWSPSSCALETLLWSKNTKTALSVAEARGAIIGLCGSFNIPVHEYNPMQVKVAVAGHGKADKKAIATMIPLLITLPQKKRLDDELDAIAVGLTCLAMHRYPHTSGRHS